MKSALLAKWKELFKKNIVRINDDYQTSQKKINDCRAQIEKLRKDWELDGLKGGVKKFKIEGEINKAIEAKKVAIDQAEERLHELIYAKEKYAVFKVNRLQHAHKCISNSNLH